jgi:hypothetical protein
MDTKEHNTFDIVNLIDRNVLSRLNRTYENKLLNKIKASFNENQQQIFVGSFYAFLNYDSKKDFVIDFDSVWRWTGFSRKDKAKNILTKHFTSEVDYKVIKAAPPSGVAGGEGSISKKLLLQLQEQVLKEKIK